ncbi:hypothetical protein IAR50_000217 [Cryptococcus sp. DSM 104548]
MASSSGSSDDVSQPPATPTRNLADHSQQKEAKTFLRQLNLSDDQYYTGNALLVGEVKPKNYVGRRKFVQGWFQTIGYVVCAHYACGSRLGVYHYADKFGRLLYLDDVERPGKKTLVIPCLPFPGCDDSGLYHIDGIEAFKTFFKDRQKGHKTLTHTLYCEAADEPGSFTLDKDEGKALHSHVNYAVDIIRNQSLRDPLERLQGSPEDVIRDVLEIPSD